MKRRMSWLIALIVAAFAGCSGVSQSNLTPPNASLFAQQSTFGDASLPRSIRKNSGGEAVLYSFAGGTADGCVPLAGLIEFRDSLYGTTSHCGLHGRGTVFKFHIASSAERTLHSFKGYPNDGGFPAGTMLRVGDTFYGTTEGGGSECGSQAGCGTVFSVTPSGTERVLHSFGNGPADGSEPFYETLLNLNGTLYGTTSVNAANDLGGTVFSITASGKEKVLCYFGTNSCHGSEPYAGLVAVNGTLYGTTAYGGSGKRCDGLGCGTVFSITTSGTESVIHSFAGGSTDGAQPMSGLIAVNGTLYGTTFGGGAGNDGTVFSITTSGRERVLHSFGRSSDGENPGVGLTRVGSRLYGTTVNGGGDSPFGSLCSGGCRVPDYFIGARNPIVGGGTVFSITTDGREKVLHSFGARGDGEVPLAVLIYDKGKLYGTTAYGGSGSASGCYATYLSGCGTVFAITP